VFNFQIIAQMGFVTMADIATVLRDIPARRVKSTSTIATQIRKGNNIFANFQIFRVLTEI